MIAIDKKSYGLPKNCLLCDFSTWRFELIKVRRRRIPYCIIDGMKKGATNCRPDHCPLIEIDDLSITRHHREIEEKIDLLYKKADKLFGVNQEKYNEIIAKLKALNWVLMDSMDLD